MQSKQITIGSRVRLIDDTNRFSKGHEFTVYGHSFRGFDLVDDQGNKMDECLFIHDKLELIEEKLEEPCIVVGDMRPLNLYKVTRNGNTDYDQYGGFVVVAYSEEDAKEVTLEKWDTEDMFYKPSKYSWVEKDEMEAKYLGVADFSVKRGIVIKDFGSI